MFRPFFFKSIEVVKGLFEIRVEYESNIYRTFCCFDKGNLVILFNGFQKKTLKTPTKELKKAERIMEEILFNDENYIENNSFVSGHDNINVFGLSEMKYFIKAGDTAIDIQLRDIKKNDLTNQNEQIDNNFLETSSPKLQGLKILGKIDLP